MNKAEQPFIGTWELVSWHLLLPDGNVTYPYGEDAVGYLIYTPGGRMSVHLAKKHRLPFSTENIMQVSSENAYRAFNETGGYCGRYEVVGDKVRHIIEICSFPNWVGTTQERTFRFTDNQLHLSHQLTYDDHTIDSFLVWLRSDTPPTSDAKDR